MTLTVAGTNGKGSVVTVLSAALVHSGKSGSRYTRPTSIVYERICIDDLEIQDVELIAAFEAIAASASISLTYFEVATLAALWIFWSGTLMFRCWRSDSGDALMR